MTVGSPQTSAKLCTLNKDIRKGGVDNCVAFDQSNHILDRIASSTAATITDLETFHIKSGPLEKTTHSIPVTPVSELVSPTIQPLGGGSVSVKCYTSTSQRAGICAGADSVQYLYAVGTTPPASAEAEGLKAGISKGFVQSRCRFSFVGQISLYLSALVQYQTPPSGRTME